MNVLSKNYLSKIYKGVPSEIDAFPIDQIAQKKWNILAQDLPLPLALIKQTALQNNRRFMQTFLKNYQVSLCPHGKTTMSPRLFQMQLEDGAWGITVATVRQMLIAIASGCQRIILANQLIGKQAIETVMGVLKEHPQLDFYCLVDSTAMVEHLKQAVQPFQLEKPLQLLIEMGVFQGRTGCRDIDSAVTIAKIIKSASPYLSLRGVEGFEGVIRGKTPAETELLIKDFLNAMLTVAEKSESYFADDEIILSAGGSAYFDLVVKYLKQNNLAKPTRIVLRSGCYLTHDSNFYQGMFESMLQRDTSLIANKPHLQAAIEIWAYVQSLPEPNMAVVALGKRDCSYDIDLPKPLYYVSPSEKNSSVMTLNDSYQVYKLDDQHAYLKIPANHSLKIGDMVGFGISHPCTTFDKWQILYLVDDHYNVIDAITTYF